MFILTPNSSSSLFSTLLSVLKAVVGFPNINGVNDNGVRFFEKVSIKSLLIVIIEVINLISWATDNSLQPKILQHVSCSSVQVAYDNQELLLIIIWISSMIFRTSTKMLTSCNILIKWCIPHFYRKNPL